MRKMAVAVAACAYLASGTAQPPVISLSDPTTARSAAPEIVERQSLAYSYAGYSYRAAASIKRAGSAGRSPLQLVVRELTTDGATVDEARAGLEASDNLARAEVSYTATASGNQIQAFISTIGAGSGAADIETRKPALSIAAFPANPSPCPAAYGAFSVGAWPPACWRPYAATSPFNRRVPADPALDPGSAEIAARLAEDPVSDIVAGDPALDFGQPIFWPLQSDPLTTIDCVDESGGYCERSLGGAEARVPEGALPAGGFSTAANEHDAHLVVVDQQSDTEYSLFNVRSIADGRIVSYGGGRSPVRGDGRGSGSTAAGFAGMAGVVRAPELEAGSVEHALALAVPCTEGSVYPAVGTAYGCGEHGIEATGAPALGSRFQLDISDAEILVLPIPVWKMALLRAFARYGAYVSDTTGYYCPEGGLKSAEPCAGGGQPASGGWAVEVEGPTTYTSFGYPDRLDAFGEAVGVPAIDLNENGVAERRFDLFEGVDWTRLRVIDPCVSDPEC